MRFVQRLLQQRKRRAKLKLDGYDELQQVGDLTRVVAMDEG